MHFSITSPTKNLKIKYKTNSVQPNRKSETLRVWHKHRSIFDKELFNYLFDKLFSTLTYTSAYDKKRKSPKQQQQPTEEIQMAVNKDIMIITGVKVKYLSLKENEYGHKQFFNVLDTTPLQYLIELRKLLKMQIWDYNDKFYLKINDLKIRELPGEHVFQKDVPYIMDLTFLKYDFQKNGEQITGYSISEIKFIKY